MVDIKPNEQRDICEGVRSLLCIMYPKAEKTIKQNIGLFMMFHHKSVRLYIVAKSYAAGNFIHANWSNIGKLAEELEFFSVEVEYRKLKGIKEPSVNIVTVFQKDTKRQTCSISRKSLKKPLWKWKIPPMLASRLQRRKNRLSKLVKDSAYQRSLNAYLSGFTISA